MTRTRMHMIVAVVAMVVVALAGFFLGVQPQLSQAAGDDDRRATITTDNRAKATELARLRERAADLPTLRDELARLTASVPDTASMSTFYASVDGIAERTGVTVSAITTADAVAYTAPSAATGDAAAPSSGHSGAATADPTTAATSAPTAVPTGAPLPATDPRVTGADLSVIPVTVSVDGTFDQALAFIDGLQDAPRLFLVNTVSSSASQETTDSAAPAGTTWTFGGYVYVFAPPAAAESGPGDAGITPTGSASAPAAG